VATLVQARLLAVAIGPLAGMSVLMNILCLLCGGAIVKPALYTLMMEMLVLISIWRRLPCTLTSSPRCIADIGMRICIPARELHRGLSGAINLVVVLKLCSSGVLALVVIPLRLIRVHGLPHRLSRCHAILYRN
jgi:hypothetical protein